VNSNHPNWTDFSSYRFIHIITDILESVVGIATHYGPDGPGIETWHGRDIPHPSRPALGPTRTPVPWVPGLIPGVKQPGRGWHVTLHCLPMLILLLWRMYKTSGSTTFISFNLSHVRQRRSCPCTKLSTPPWRRMIQLPTHYVDTTNGTHPVPEAQFAEPAVAHSMSGIALPFVQTVEHSHWTQLLCFVSARKLFQYSASEPLQIWQRVV